MSRMTKNKYSKDVPNLMEPIAPQIPSTTKWHAISQKTNPRNVCAIKTNSFAFDFSVENEFNEEISETKRISSKEMSNKFVNKNNAFNEVLVKAFGATFERWANDAIVNALAFGPLLVAFAANQ